MTEKTQPSRRAVVHTGAAVAAIAALNFINTQPAAADAVPPEQAKQASPRRRVPVGLL